MPLLFSYGTLQQESVQRSTFGRLLAGQPDELVGFEQSLRKVDDPAFVVASGRAHHAIVRFNGRSESRVPGMVFEVSETELARADAYEPDGYRRISTVLASVNTHQNLEQRADRASRAGAGEAAPGG